jgi:hypothetical protein
MIGTGKANRCLALITIVIIIFAISGCMSLAPDRSSPPSRQNTQSQPALSKTTKIPPLTLENYQKPPEMVDPDELLGFSDVAWRTFVTLNWPSDCNGIPLADKTLGEVPAAPRVWESYRTPEEVFLENGTEPERPQPDQCARQGDRKIQKAKTIPLDLTEGRGLVSPQEFENIQKKLAQSPANRGVVGNPAQNPQSLTDIPLIDRQGNYVLIETRLNPDEFRQIFENKWYKAESFKDYRNDPDSKDPIDKPIKRFQFASTVASRIADSMTIYKGTTDRPSSPWTGAPIEIKAAWRVFNNCDGGTNPTQAQQSCKRYYTTKRELAIPASQYAPSPGDDCVKDGVCKTTVEVGLIGFHILYKVPNQVNKATPGWIWATFEQVDNLANSHLSTLLFDPTDRDCSIDPPAPDYLWQKSFPHAVRDRQFTAHLPTPVVRCETSKPLATDRDPLQHQNQIWQTAFNNTNADSPWQYYQLNGVEWLSSPKDVLWEGKPWSEMLNKIQEGIAGGPLVNVTMEAYAQTDTVIGNKCIACHLRQAKLPHSGAFSDFSFLLSHAK